MSKKIGVFPWVDFAFRKIFGKPGNEECLIGLRADANRIHRTRTQRSGTRTRWLFEPLQCHFLIRSVAVVADR
ncbi:MAG: hypothetical protein RLZZ396_2446 [Planctomycetota bacterium]|jgi:hypothetical protein